MCPSDNQVPKVRLYLLVLCGRPGCCFYWPLVIIKLLNIKHFPFHLRPCLEVLALHDLKEHRVKLQSLLRILEHPDLVLQPLGPPLFLKHIPIPFIKQNNKPIVVHMPDNPPNGLVDRSGGLLLVPLLTLQTEPWLLRFLVQVLLLQDHLGVVLDRVGDSHDDDCAGGLV